MQAWKYSLPAFLVPFLFSASTGRGEPAASWARAWPDFLLAFVNSCACLFFLSIGIVGYFRGRLSLLERGCPDRGGLHHGRRSPSDFSV